MSPMIAPVKSPSEGPMKAPIKSPIEPNLLMIVTDQQQFHALGFVQERLSRFQGKLKIRTPNLDLLAQTGAVFENAYCVSPLCVPSRATLATGNSLQRTGVLTNEGQFSSNYNKISNVNEKGRISGNIGSRSS